MQRELVMCTLGTLGITFAVSVLSSLSKRLSGLVSLHDFSETLS